MNPNGKHYLFIKDSQQNCSLSYSRESLLLLSPTKMFKKTALVLALSIWFPLEFSPENNNMNRFQFYKFIQSAEAVSVACSRRDGTIDQECIGKTKSRKTNMTVRNPRKSYRYSSARGQLELKRKLRLQNRKDGDKNQIARNQRRFRVASRIRKPVVRVAPRKLTLRERIARLRSKSLNK